MVSSIDCKFVQIIECRLSRHREAFAKSMHRSCKVWYLILAHILTFFDLQKYNIFLIQPNNNSKSNFPTDRWGYCR